MIVSVAALAAWSLGASSSGLPVSDNDCRVVRAAVEYLAKLGPSTDRSFAKQVKMRADIDRKSQDVSAEFAEACPGIIKYSMQGGQQILIVAPEYKEGGEASVHFDFFVDAIRHATGTSSALKFPSRRCTLTKVRAKWVVQACPYG